jgi:succinate dehydrogenase / fumarate reductase cytochrome b subunit
VTATEQQTRPGSASASVQNPHFLLRRIHSLVGLVPVGAFLLFHLWENSQSRFGQEHYNTYVVEKIQNINYIVWLEIFLIAVPILFHGIYGLVVFWMGRSNVTHYGYFRNWMWWLQRWSGVGILLFLGMHVIGTRIIAIWSEAVRQDMYSHMRNLLSEPAFLVPYLWGLVFAVFHFCNGVWSASIVWGLTTTPRAQKIMQVVMGVAFLVITALGIHGMLGFFLSS